MTPANANQFRKSGPTRRIVIEAPPRRSASHPIVNSPSRPLDGGSRRWRLALLAAMAVASVAFLQPWKAWPLGTPATESHAPAAALTVKIDRPTPATASSVVLPATVRPWATTTLHARVSGYLTAWHKDLGAQVKAGEVLAEIETPELDQEVAESQALADEALAAAVQAKAERLEGQAELRVAEAQLARVLAETELVKSQLKRRERLLASQTITQEEYDTFARQFEARVADGSAAKADVARRRTNLDTRAAIVAARQATAASRQANVERLKELQRFKHIVAPFDGVVTQRTAEVGLLVNAGQEPLFVVEDMRRVRVQVNVPQTHAAHTAAGVAATVRLPESGLPALQASVTRVADSVDATSRTMLAEVELDNGSRAFQPGAYAQVTLAMPPDAQSWTIATSALQMRVDGPHVAVLDESNAVQLKPVTLGRDLGSRVVVVAGIAGGERLVVNPRDTLTNGTRVHVERQAESASTVAQR
jgi:multidrug efflux pump subunit AcrA (membrane-fusion protein)